MTRLEAIRARVANATPGPWEFKTDGMIAKIILPTAEFRDFSHHDLPNAEFLAHAREDIPHLLTLVDDLAGALKGVMELVEYGWLVRNTTNDAHLPSYIAEATTLTKALAKARAALARTEE